MRATIENKLETILQGKTFRIEHISKKLSKRLSSTELINTQDITIYLVQVYMYSDNSDFIKIENIINNINNPLYKDYLLQYIRYDKYTELVYSIINVLVLIFLIMIDFDIPFKIIIQPLFNNFWLGILLYTLIPFIILYQFIAPRIVKNLLKYDISKTILRLAKFITLSIWVIYTFVMIFII